MRIIDVFQSIREHASGMTGQAAASAPLLLVTVWMSRVASLELAGRFTVVVGVSAASYAIAQWGLRTSVVIDGFRAHSPGLYLLTRALMLTVAGVVTAIGGIWMEVGAPLVLTIIALRTTDGLIDLTLAFLQVLRGTAEGLRFYARAHLSKLGLAVSPLVAALVVDVPAMEWWLLAAACVALVTFCVKAIRSGIVTMGRPPVRSGLRHVLEVLSKARWYAVAVAVCAILTSLPRIVIPGFYQGDTLGVVGVSLSVSTFFGMAFFTTWLRYLPRFESAGTWRSTLLHYLTEWVLLVAVLGLVAATVFPTLVGWVFDFSDARLLSLCRKVLASSVIFAGGMTLANLYKLTGRAWMESVTYLVPIGLLGMTVTILSWPESIPLLLAVAGVLLAGLSIPAVREVGRR